jgi:hypothetical protein
MGLIIKSPEEKSQAENGIIPQQTWNFHQPLAHFFITPFG